MNPPNLSYSWLSRTWPPKHETQRLKQRRRRRLEPSRRQRAFTALSKVHRRVGTAKCRLMRASGRFGTTSLPRLNRRNKRAALSAPRRWARETPGRLPRRNKTRMSGMTGKPGQVVPRRKGLADLVIYLYKFGDGFPRKEFGCIVVCDRVCRGPSRFFNLLKNGLPACR